MFEPSLSLWRRFANTCCLATVVFALSLPPAQAGEQEAAANEMHALLSHALFNGETSSSLPVVDFVASCKSHELSRECLNSLQPDMLTAESQDPVTSCVINSMLIAFLLLPKQDAKNLIAHFMESHEALTMMRLPSGGTIELTVNNLFAGLHLYKTARSKHYHDMNSRQRSRVVTKMLAKPAHTLADEISTQLPAGSNRRNAHRAVEIALATNQATFNQPVLKNLRHEIHRRRNQVSARRSFLYLVGISIANEQEGFKAFEHAFVIEQFKHRRFGESFRIYQSWIEEMNLEEGLAEQHRHYGRDFMTRQELSVFLAKLERRYCYHDLSTKDCFAHGSSGRGSPLAYAEGHTIYGQGLRFVSAPFDPRQSLRNLSRVLAGSSKARAVVEAGLRQRAWQEALDAEMAEQASSAEEPSCWARFWQPVKHWWADSSNESSNQNSPAAATLSDAASCDEL